MAPRRIRKLTEDEQRALDRSHEAEVDDWIEQSHMDQAPTITEGSGESY